FADVTVTPQPADGVAATDPLPAVVTTSVLTWAVPWMLLVAVAIVAAAIVLAVWLRRRSRERLADDLAAYADEIRAAERLQRDARETEREVVR
ncbi:hypothetical protein ACV2XQ_21805, partial [Enterobacter hormaechei]